jgi:hypothetical protein
MFTEAEKGDQMQSVIRFMISLTILVLITGCAIQQRRAVFNEEEYRAYAGKGSGTIVGQAFMVARNGDVKYGAGRAVILSPVTSYSKEWYEEFVLKGRRLTEPDPRALKYIRITQADGEGRFEFKDVPAGSYFIACFIQWEYTAGSSTGGIAHAEVKIGNGETVKVVVTR